MEQIMTESIQVRAAVAADGPEVARLLAMLGHGLPAGDPVVRLADFLARGEGVLVASRADSGVAGPLLGVVTLHVTSVLHRAGPIGRLTSLLVDEPARGQGVGAALVSAAEAVFAARNCAMVEVTSNKKRIDAHAFYERLGYTATSLRFAKPLVTAAPPHAGAP
jgi:GNAT superfamily N-acetyltransferase